MPIQNIAEFEDLVSRLPAFDQEAANAARARQQQLTKPPGSLGRLEEVAVWLSGWQQAEKPRCDKVQVLVFAGNHGVTAQGVSAFPAEVTAQMVRNFSSGGAAVNQLCKLHGADLRVIPLYLDQPTGDITREPAMTEARMLECFNAGMAAVQPCDILIVGEMGIGNTTVAAALACAVFGGNADWVGRGTGVDDPGLARKADAVCRALARHEKANDPLALLASLGGHELSAMAGAIFAARAQRIPVLLDGYVVGAAAACLILASADCLAHCVAGHVSAEAAHPLLLEKLGLTPLLSLGMRLGEATGALAALPLLRAAVATHNGMATFAEAGVSGE